MSKRLKWCLRLFSKLDTSPENEIAIALDPAASEFFRDGKYVFKKSDNSAKSPEDMVHYWAEWAKEYPIVSLEDGLAEDDWAGWKRV